jgi:hypothetical protein
MNVHVMMAVVDNVLELEDYIHHTVVVDKLVLVQDIENPLELD